MERDKNTYITLHWYKNFNSHAHVERDDAECVRRGLIKISTHTLTWSVTFPILFCKVRILISTHTLTWSVTDKRTKQTRYQFISTHTLTWSVTMNTFKSNALKEFQLTRSRGAWPERDDGDISTVHISTHTLTWSVTTYGWYPVLYHTISTHTLTWSVTIGFYPACDKISISTHTLTWSVTHPLKLEAFLLLFQLTRSRGAWPARHPQIFAGCHFNSHAHVERDPVIIVYHVI